MDWMIKELRFESQLRQENISSPKFQTDFGVHPVSYSMEIGEVSSPRDKGEGTWSLTPSSAKINIIGDLKKYNMVVLIAFKRL